MRKFIVKRLFYSLISLILLSLMIFLIVRITGDPTTLLVEPGASKGDIEALRAQLGLDRPLWVQYGSVHEQPASGRLRPVVLLPNTRLRALPVAPSVLAVPGRRGHGLLAHHRYPQRNHGRHAGQRVVGPRWENLFPARTLPATVLGGSAADPVLFRLPRLAAVLGAGGFQHVLMPAFALGWFFAAAHMRLTRSSMLEVLGSEYVKLARLKGLPEALVIAKHAFKNALIPVLTLAGINLVLMVNVAVVVETVFAWPGVGRLMLRALASAISRSCRPPPYWEGL